MAEMSDRLDGRADHMLRLWGDRTRKRPRELAPVIRRNGQEIEMVELVWGLRPRNAEDGPIINIRSEGRTFPTHRCLVPAIDFFFRDQSEARRRWRFTLADGDSFYLAGIWRQASDDWPEAYAVLTTASNPDVAPVNDRQMVVIPRAARLDWLDGLAPQEELLRSLPAGTFRRELVR
jgi:putative SOS response-associated peptidase YedK